MRGTFPACCASAARGTAKAPPSEVSRKRRRSITQSPGLPGSQAFAAQPPGVVVVPDPWPHGLGPTDADSRAPGTDPSRPAGVASEPFHTLGRMIVEWPPEAHVRLLRGLWARTAAWALLAGGLSGERFHTSSNVAASIVTVLPLTASDHCAVIANAFSAVESTPPVPRPVVAVLRAPRTLPVSPE